LSGHERPQESFRSSLIWSVADLLRGDVKQSDYGKVILPFTVLCRLDCVRESIRKAVLAELDKRTKAGLNADPFLLKTAGHSFFTPSPLDLKTLLGDQVHLGENETAGQHFTPREVVRLMVNLLLIEDDDALKNPGIVRSIYDPTARTGGSKREVHMTTRLTGAATTFLPFNQVDHGGKGNPVNPAGHRTA